MVFIGNTWDKLEEIRPGPRKLKTKSRLNRLLRPHTPICVIRIYRSKSLKKPGRAKTDRSNFLDTITTKYRKNATKYNKDRNQEPAQDRPRITPEPAPDRTRQSKPGHGRSHKTRHQATGTRNRDNKSNKDHTGSPDRKTKRKHRNP